MADELGYYEEEGVDVEFVEISDTAAAISAISLNKNDIDVLQVAGAGALSYIGQGTNVEVIGGIASEGGAMITLPENAKKSFGLNEYLRWNNCGRPVDRYRNYPWL